MSRRLASCACVLLGLALLPLWARVPQPKSYALLVGVGDYEHAAFSKLQYTENDVEALAKILDRPGSPFHGRVRVLTCSRGEKDKKDRPTAANVRAAVAELVKDRTRNETVLVALSGHGMELSVKDPAEKKPDKSFPFFCPADAQLKGTDYETGKNPRLVGVKELMAELEDCGAGGKLVLMDACRNEYKARAASRALGARKGLVPEGVAAMFSCKSGQVSFETDKLEHGVFFHYVLKGLEGDAAVDGEVTWRDLTSYVVRNVKKNAPDLVGGGAEQSPVTIEVEVDNAFLLRPAGEVVKETTKSPKENPGKEEVVKGWPKEITNSIDMKLVQIPKGKFRMGSSKGEKDRFDDEGPEHEVEITEPFHLGVYEVTQEEYEKVMGSSPSYCSATGGGKASVNGMDTGRFPVENVSYEDAVKFCERLTRREKEKKRLYRLPTEAEWEYACRGPAGSKKQPFHYGDSLSSGQANFNGNSPYGGAETGTYLERTCKVGSYKANDYGLYDMHGNVMEWCSDWYGTEYYADSPSKNPTGPSEGSSRVFRGGSWNSYGRYCRSADRRRGAPAYRDQSIGFRVALVPSKE